MSQKLCCLLCVTFFLVMYWLHMSLSGTFSLLLGFGLPAYTLNPILSILCCITSN